MARLTWDTLRDLARFRSANGCAISLYLDLAPSASPTQRDAETRLRALLAQAEKERRPDHDHAQKLALDSDLGRIREWWTHEFVRDGSRGLALFASAGDGLWQALPLVQPVPDRVAVASDLRLAPLVPLVGRDDGALVAVVSRERGQVFRLRDGRLQELVDESEEQPGRHDQGGWSQANYQRHIEKLVHDHLKTVGGELDRRVRRLRPDLVVVAPEELRTELEGALSTEAREAVVGWAQAEAHASPAELLEVVRPILDRVHEARAGEKVERWLDELGRGGRACAGWADTLGMASDGRVELLLVGSRAAREAWACPECGRAAAGEGACPLDGAARTPHPDGADLAARLTLAAGGEVLAAEHDGLAGHDGIGALLRF